MAMMSCGISICKCDKLACICNALPNDSAITLLTRYFIPMRNALLKCSAIMCVAIYAILVCNTLLNGSETTV